MTAVTDAITVCNILAGKDLTAQELLSIANRYNASFGSEWANPHESGTPEYDAWPTNDERAQFLLTKMRDEARKRLYTIGYAEGEVNSAAAVLAAAQAAADEL